MSKKELDIYRQEVAAQVSGTVLEIGFGSGLNLPYYKNITKLYALEPAAEIYKLAAERIAAATFPVEYLADSAEHISLPDHSVDSVISTWTLCSIPRPDLALAEIHRILKPGGKFSFIEHGKSPKKLSAGAQKLLTPLWKLCSGGCHLDRDISALITAAGFSFEQLDTFQHNKPLMYMYKGTAQVRQ